jgi:AcrR family transcriptional regulator
MDALKPIWLRLDDAAPPGKRAVASLAAAAMKVADKDGLDAVSMRRMASELGVGTMTLYHYVSGKDDLLDLMLDAATAERIVPAGELPGGWRAGLETISRRSREAFHRHEWLLTLVGERQQSGPNAMRVVEQALTVLASAGADEATRVAMLAAAEDYVVGFVARELAGEQVMRRRGISWAQWQEAMGPYVAGMLATGEFPQLTRYAEAAPDTGPDENFEQGLGWLLDGMAARLARA